MSSREPKARGRPSRLGGAFKVMSQRDAYVDMSKDAEPAFALAKRLATDGPRRGRERYLIAAREVAAKFNISVRTLERRASLYRWMTDAAPSFGTDAERARIRNFLKAEITAGRGEDPASLPPALRIKPVKR